MIVFHFAMATAFPVGVQSFVVMDQGLRFGYPKVLVGIVTASLCDGFLILLGGAADRFAFAAGAISASWVWFVAIGFGASLLRARLTPPVRLWTRRVSGGLMLVLAGALLPELLCG